jgi:hypothetical protein
MIGKSNEKEPLWQRPWSHGMRNGPPGILSPCSLEFGKVRSDLLIQ